MLIGIDVSLELSSACVVDASGKVYREGKVESEPESIVPFIESVRLPIARVGLEASPLSQWLHDGIRKGGYDTVLFETRHVKVALSAMVVKTDRRDARGIAQLLSNGIGQSIASRCHRRKCARYWRAADKCRAKESIWNRPCEGYYKALV